MPVGSAKQGFRVNSRFLVNQFLAANSSLEAFMRTPGKVIRAGVLRTFKVTYNGMLVERREGGSEREVKRTTRCNQLIGSKTNRWTEPGRRWRATVLNPNPCPAVNRR